MNLEVLHALTIMYAIVFCKIHTSDETASSFFTGGINILILARGCHLCNYVAEATLLNHSKKLVSTVLYIHKKVPLGDFLAPYILKLYKTYIVAKEVLSKYSLAENPLRVNSVFSARYTNVEVINMYKRIREMREDKDLTQVQIAKVLNCSQRVYSNYERGELDIPTNILIKLAKFHGVTTDYILEID